MSTNPSSFRGLKSPVGKAAWAHVAQPHESLTPGKFVYDLALEIDESDLEKLAQLAEACVDQHREDNPQFPKRDDNLIMPWTESRGPKKADGSKGDPIPGKWLLKFKANAERLKNGVRTKARPPMIFDSLGNPMKPGEDIEEITPGSEVRVAFDMYAYNTAGNAGVGLGLRAVQVKSLATDSYDFDEIEGGYTVGNGSNEEVPF